ncbi:unnamed protein product [Lathyrus oleraceus]
MDELLPGVEQRFCVCHLYNNFRKRFPGKKLKEIIWKVAKSTYSQSWEKEMREMRDVNEEAFKHMMKTPHRFWSKSQFKTTSKCDSMLNNMSEDFNSVIIEAKSKPIVTMLEEIRTYIMEMWAKNRMRFANLTDDDILPNIMKRITRISEYTNMWIVRMSAKHIFEVMHLENAGDKFSVNLQDQSCTCRKWQLTTLPCVLAISSMKSINFKVESYIPDMYKKDYF